jgi:cell division septation protein DedD
VSDQYEPSYYEIALTGRQVLVAFVILLVCMVAAFFSGVWIGRGGDTADDQPAEIAHEEPQGDEPLQELSFFEEEPMDRPRDLGDVAREPRKDTTLREDVTGRGGAEPAPPPDETADRPEAPVPSPAPVPDRPDERRRKAPDATPSGSLSTGDVVIQVFSSAEEPKAREMLDRLEKKGFRAFLSPLADGGRTLYRVRVGPFELRRDAEATAARLRTEMGLETWITQ